MNLYYDVVIVEDGLYYIKFYAIGNEYPPINLRLNETEFDKWKEDKIER